MCLCGVGGKAFADRGRMGKGSSWYGWANLALGQSVECADVQPWHGPDKRHVSGDRSHEERESIWGDRHGGERVGMVHRWIRSWVSP